MFRSAPTQGSRTLGYMPQPRWGCSIEATYLLKVIERGLPVPLEEPFCVRPARDRDFLLGEEGHAFAPLHVKVAKEWQRDPKQLGKLGF